MTSPSPETRQRPLVASSPSSLSPPSPPSPPSPLSSPPSSPPSPPSLAASTSSSAPPPSLRSLPLHLPSSHASSARLSYPPYHPSSNSPYPIVSVPLTFMPSAESSPSSFHNVPHPIAEDSFADGPLDHSESHSVLAADTLLLKDETMASYPPLALPPSPTAATPTTDMSTSDSLLSGSNATTTHDIEGGPIPNHLGEQHQNRDEDEGVIDTTADAAAAASRPRSVVDFALDSASMPAGGRQVRRNMIARLSGRWTEVPRRSRVILVWSSIMTLLKILATIVVLIVDRDSPSGCLYLKVLIILYAARSIIKMPFTIYAHLHPRVQGAPLTSRDLFLDRQNTLMEIAGTCLFFLCNYFLFTLHDCRDQAPGIFYLTLVYVVLGYIQIMIPILLCLAVILCLPLVLWAMRFMGVGPVSGLKAATEEMIAAIPVVRYRKPASAPQESLGDNLPEDGSDGVGSVIHMSDRSDGSTAPTTGAGPSAGATSISIPSGLPASHSQPTPRRSKFNLMNRFRRVKKASLAGQPAASEGVANNLPVEYLTLEDEQDAVCAICLCEYEDEEELRKMKCNHYFHKECVDEWLRIHRNCPLCKRDIDDPASANGSASTAPASRPGSPTTTPPVASVVSQNQSTPISPLSSPSRRATPP
ncbi:hypothetical protein EMPS_11207 [Entomortierella parvispora]|uniref:RING-type domain-containing protein n=1 Tax=Entomortierella parvispora TaxID=205924 RepID=A0A9P3M207_9FUNG|nr:hypothetical protein EMPS_11207 [Entomortierella parvispora]